MRLSLTPSIPWPTPPEFESDGNISPKRRPRDRGTGGTEVGEVGCERLTMDLDAEPAVLREARGFAMRLAKDCELLDTWSSATDLFLCVDRLDEEAAPGSWSRVTEDRRAAYDVDAFAGEERPPVAFGTPEVDDSLDVRERAFRAVGLLVDCAACWSNLCFRSFTLGFWPLP